MDNMENNVQSAPTPEQQTPAPSMPKPEQQFKTPVENKALQPKKPKSKLLVPLLVVLVLAVIGAGAWYYVYGRDDDTADTTTTTDTSATTSTSGTTGTTSSTATTTDTTTTDETAGWKTYTNDTYKFSVKYPTNWLAQTETPTDKNPTVAYITSPKNPSRTGNSPVYHLSGELTMLFSWSDKAAATLRTEAADHTGGISGAFTNESQQEVDFAGGTKALTYFRDFNTTDDGGPTRIKDYYVESTPTIHVSISSPIEGSDAVFAQAEKIMNTFQFTSAVSTADWKTYTNSTYGFSFKYPKEWNTVEFPKTEEDGPGGDLAVYVGPSITRSSYADNSVHIIYFKSSSVECGLCAPNGMDPVSNTATAVDGVQAKKYIGSGIEYVAVKNNHRYEIGTTSGSNTSLATNLENIITTITLK